MEYFVIFFGCAFGCALNVVCGFGFGIFCMIFLPYFVGGTAHAAELISIVTLFQASFFALHYRRHIRWRLLLVPMAAYIVLSILTVRYASRMDNAELRMLLGILLIALSLYFMFAAKRLRVRANVRNGLLAGGLGGVMSGLFSIGGPPMSLYFSAATEEKEEYLATIQMYYVVSNAIVIALRARTGIMSGRLLLFSAIGLAGMLLGSFLGNHLFRRLRAESIRRAMYIMMLVSGIVMLTMPLVRR